VKLTDSGRQVTGGAASTPDITVPAPKLTKFEQLLYRDDTFFPAETGVGGFTRYYLGAKPAISKDFEVDDNVMRVFREYLSKHNVRYTEPEMPRASTGSSGRSAGSVYVQLRTAGGLQGTAEADPQVQKAVEAIPQARALYQNAKKIVAQRAGGPVEQP